MGIGEIVGVDGSTWGGADIYPGGKLYVYRGSARPDVEPDAASIGRSGDEAGTRISRAGDLNRDGFGDIVVGLGRGPSMRVFLGGNLSDDPQASLAGAGGDSAEDFGSAVSP
ncbi:hypothetical protein [Sorangium sp. So ce1335]|uniref:hypothetical protein n=1 Tax=Sorangium sp. So ce1335 TaxID=3133335 RepID=UPI003F5D7C0B